MSSMAAIPSFTLDSAGLVTLCHAGMEVRGPLGHTKSALNPFHTPCGCHHASPCTGQAVRKLTFLQMMGYDMSWASFSVVEVMSSSRFAHKRIGYLAACQTFTDTTDVILLTTNLLKKEFQSPNQYEVRGGAVSLMAFFRKGKESGGLEETF